MNYCNVCVISDSALTDLSRRSYNGQTLLNIFQECTNVVTSSCYLCRICEKGLKFSYNFKRKAFSANQLFTKEIKIEREDKGHSINANDHSETVPKFFSPKYRCRYCLQGFAKNRERLEHEALHLYENKGLECHFCTKKYPKKELVKHIKRVHWRDPSIRYYCDSCSKNFSAYSTLCTHKKLFHENSDSNQKFTCYHCRKEFARKNLLKRHIQLVHENLSEVTCHYCQHKFKTKNSLKLHIIAIHLKLKPFECEICNKKFSSAGSKSSHMQTHTQQRNFQCNQCDMTFKSNSYLQKHQINRHSNQYNYECSICYSCFKTTTGLKMHLASHYQSQFECVYCIKKFTRKQGMMEHVRAVHSGQRLLCMDCNQEFSRHDALKKHFNAFHSNVTFKCKCGLGIIKKFNYKQHLLECNQQI